MKYVFLCVLILAVCCAGCIGTGRYLRGVFPRPYRRPEPIRSDELAQAAGVPGDQAPGTDEHPPLTHPAGGPGDAQPVEGPDAPRRVLVRKPEKELLRRRISVGLSLGSAYGNRDEAIDGIRESEFGIGMLVGARVTYFPPMWKSNVFHKFITRCGIEFRIDDYTLMLSDDGLDLGKLHTTSAIFAFKVCQMPQEGNVFGFHFHAGLGWGTTFFRKSGMLRQDDAANGRYTKIISDTATILCIGAGADFYVAPNVVVSLDCTYVNATVPVQWSEDGTRRRDILRFDPNSTQLSFSFSYFF